MFEQKCIEVKYEPSPAQVPGQAHFDGNCTFYIIGGKTHSVIFLAGAANS